MGCVNSGEKKQTNAPSKPLDKSQKYPNESQNPAKISQGP